MSKIRIDRLEIRLKGVSAQTARDLTTGLGAEIVRQLSGREAWPRNGGATHIDEIHVPPIRSFERNSPSTLRRMIGDSVAGAIVSASEEANST